MTHSFQRTQRIGDEIQKALADLLLSKAHDPRFHHISLTAVDLSPDAKNANIFFSILEESELKTTLKALNKAAGFFRHHLAQTLNLRYTPKLTFIYDNSIVQGNKLSDLINKAEESDND